MKYKLKNDKQSYYTVCDWAEQYDYEHKDMIAKVASTIRIKGAPATYNKPVLSGKSNGFKRIDWNQWDDEKGCIKDMYIEFTDLKLDLIFLCSVANCIDNKEENALH
jgi:hypothetical protein